MREKRLRCVLTFSTTADAMAMEAAAREHGLPGRMIPVPSEIDAGCGFAWRCELEERDALLTGAKERGLAYEGVFEVAMY
ncbi:MAG: DUF3343 domain-containing protein [Coriobacteriaceae bacterium]|nr:DUF3343 domain-containing protein [Coriobacteriaceae bacterium]